MKNKTVRFAAVVFVLLLLFLVYAPSLLHMFHEHRSSGAPCPFCVAMVESSYRLKRLAALAVCMLLIKLLRVLYMFSFFCLELCERPSPSLVSEYVRMNN